MTGMTDQTSLAATLRVWRERLTPDQVGLPFRAARRRPGCAARTSITDCP